MAGRKKYPVPTAAIKREITRAQQKLRKMTKTKVEPKKLRDIHLQMKVLRVCHKAIDDILGT